MSLKTPKMHAPNSNGKALCSPNSNVQGRRVALSVEFFKAYKPINDTQAGGRCKVCEKKL